MLKYESSRIAIHSEPSGSMRTNGQTER